MIHYYANNFAFFRLKVTLCFLQINSRIYHWLWFIGYDSGVSHNLWVITFLLAVNAFSLSGPTNETNNTPKDCSKVFISKYKKPQFIKSGLNFELVDLGWPMTLTISKHPDLLDIFGECIEFSYRSANMSIPLSSFFSQMYIVLSPRIRATVPSHNHRLFFYEFV